MEDILVPRNSLVFAQSLSRSLAVNSPQLTLDFIKEWISSFPRSGIPQQTACVQYIGPWLPNLEAFAKPSRDDAAETVKQVTEIIRGLISLTVSEYTVSLVLDFADIRVYICSCRNEYGSRSRSTEAL